MEIQLEDIWYKQACIGMPYLKSRKILSCNCTLLHYPVADNFTCQVENAGTQWVKSLQTYY